MGWRRISCWLNRSGNKTYCGKTWSKTGSSVLGVIKRMRQREERLAKKKFKTKPSITNFQIGGNY